MARVMMPVLMIKGNWMSPIIGRGGVNLLPALWGWGRGMLPMKECLGLAGGRPHPNPPPEGEGIYWGSGDGCGDGDADGDGDDDAYDADGDGGIDDGAG